VQLKVGSRLRSIVSDTEVIVVRAPKAEVDLTCGGYPMNAVDASSPAAPPDPKPELTGETKVGKRYADEELGLEVLVTKAGLGLLAVNGAELLVREAKPLPASD
jgi:hypothetical protein